MKRLSGSVLLIMLLVLFSGCQTVNRGLDKTNEAAQEVGKPIGKVMSIPGSVAEGAAEGMITKEDEENPFNR